MQKNSAIQKSNAGLTGFNCQWWRKNWYGAPVAECFVAIKADD